MIINHNISALYANRQLKFNTYKLNKDIEKLSSGMRINYAADDPAGLAVSEKMRSQIRGLKQAERNIQLGVSFLQTADGYLNETTEILQRIRELAVQAANGIYTTEDRNQIQLEVSQLVSEVDRIASHAQFNGLNLLTGKFALPETTPVSGQGPVYIHVGPNTDQRVAITLNTMTATALNLKDVNGNSLSISTADKANMAIGIVDDALMKVTTQRAKIGAFQSRFEKALKGIAIARENLTGAESKIRDTDMAQAISNMVKNQILVQADTALLAQANNLNALVLRLF